MVNNLPLLWKDTCTITVSEAYTKSNRATGFRDVVLCADEPCKISFFNNGQMNNTASVSLIAADVIQRTKLFIRSGLDIPEGSRITVVTHTNGKTLHYKSSGTPAIFTNHQEIILEGDKEWA